MTQWKRYAAIACLLLPAGRGQAQWEQTAGPRGWTVTSMAEQQGYVVALTVEGTVFRSRDHGAHWESCSAGFSGQNAGTLRVLNGSMFACVGTSGGLYCSENGGADWRRIIPDTLTAVDIVALGGQLFIAMGRSNDGVMRSVDNGATWQDASSGLPSLSTCDAIAAAGGDLYVLCGSKLYRSSDSGAHWAIPDPTFRDRIYTIAQLGNTILIQGDYNVYRSTDRGASWIGASPAVKSLWEIWTSGDDLFAMRGNAVYRSADSGASWQEAPGFPGRFWRAGAALYYPERRGMRRSDDGGLSWTSFDTAPIGTLVQGFAQRGNRMAAMTLRKDVFVSHDAGASWTQLGADMENVHLFCVAFAGENLLAGGTCTSGGIDLTDNNGAVWQRVSDTLGSYGRIQAEAFAAREPEVYAAGNGIWKSTNCGRAWTSCNQLWNASYPPYFNSIFFMDSVLCAAGDFFTRSTDGGRHWVPEQDDTPASEFGCMTSGGGMLYARMSRDRRYGLYRSADLGTTWQAIDAGVGDAPVSAMLAAGSCLFAATFGNGVLLSEDSGTTWKAVSGGLGASYIASLHADGGLLFAGTCGRGVWRCSIADLLDAAHAPVSVTLEQNYPNPFSATAAIRYGLPEAGSVTLRVFDMLGREVRAMPLGEQRAGMHTMRLDAAGLPNGSYTYRLEAGGVAVARRMTIMH